MGLVTFTSFDAPDVIIEFDHFRSFSLMNRVMQGQLSTQGETQGDRPVGFVA